MLSYLPHLKLPWATVIFTLETTWVSGRCGEHPDPLLTPDGVCFYPQLSRVAAFSLPGVVGPVGDEGGQEPFDLRKEGTKKEKGKKKSHLPYHILEK